MVLTVWMVQQMQNASALNLVKTTVVLLVQSVLEMKIVYMENAQTAPALFLPSVVLQFLRAYVVDMDRVTISTIWEFR